MTQLQKVFFDPTAKRLHPHLPARPSDGEISLALARNNSACPLNKIIVSDENEGNFRILQRFAFSAYTKYNRSCRGCSFAIYCPPGQGKTFIVKRFAETIGIPFVFVQSSALKDTFDLYQQIVAELERSKAPPLVVEKTATSDVILPPMIIFFDETHEIKPELQRGALLNPMEPDDGIMHVRMSGTGNELLRADCKEVCWIAASTDPADLFDAFRSRFINSIEWNSAGPVELPIIIKAGLDLKVQKKELPFSPPIEACKIISHFQQVPRLAIHGFGQMAVMQKRMYPSHTWGEVCATIAKDLQIDEWGMTRRQVQILSALGQRPMAKASLGDICKCRLGQVETMELPGLRQYNNGGPYVVSITGRGMCITAAGQRELDKRKIPHNGKKVTAEHFESMR